MASIWDERFEGAGYEESWSDSEHLSGAGATLNEDYDTSLIASPANWGSQCLYSSVDANLKYAFVRNIWGTPPAKTYLHAEVYIPNWTLIPSSDSSGFIVVQDASWNTSYYVRVLENGAGAYNFQYWNQNGGYLSDNTISLNTKYIIEVYHDTGTNDWEWRIDGVSQDSGTSGITRAFSALDIGVSDNWKGMSICVDNVLIDNATWPVIGGGELYYIPVQVIG